MQLRDPEIIKANRLVGSVVAAVVLLASMFWLTVRTSFLLGSIEVTGQIVSVSHEYVPRGRGSVLAYVPVVEITQQDRSKFTTKVDMYNENPIYTVGTQMNLRCSFPSAECRPMDDSAISYLLFPSLLAFFCAVCLLIGIRSYYGKYGETESSEISILD